MDAFRYEPIDWSIALDGRQWRMDATIGVGLKGRFGGVRMSVRERHDFTRPRYFEIWEESDFVIPSEPRTALFVIGNVLSGATNAMHEQAAAEIAVQAADQYLSRHRRL